MHFLKFFIKDTWKFSSFLNTCAIPDKKIASVLGLLMCYLKPLPLTAVLSLVRTCTIRKVPLFSVGACTHHTPSPHLFWPRSAVPRCSGLVLVSTDSEWAGLPSWKVAWSYVVNPSSYSGSKLIKLWSTFPWSFQTLIKQKYIQKWSF